MCARLSLLPTAEGVCEPASDCTTTNTAGARRIHKEDRGAYFATPTCAVSSPVGTIPSCTRFYWTGAHRVWSCSGVKRCFAKIQLSPSGEGTEYWLLDHACGTRSTMVPDTNTE